jgi:hypothetical protein
MRLPFGVSLDGGKELDPCIFQIPRHLLCDPGMVTDSDGVVFYVQKQRNGYDLFLVIALGGGSDGGREIRAFISKGRKFYPYGVSPPPATALTDFPVSFAA